VLSRPVRLCVASAGGAIVALSAVIGASAHEHRMVGNGAFLMRVGWNSEPTFTGVRNAVQLFLSDVQDNPITDLAGSLTVEVMYQGQKSDALTLEPAFGATFGTKGEYDAPLLPTRPGDYTFHVSGAIHGIPVDESFTSSPKTFDPVKDDATIQFPVRDPSRGELSTGVQRLVTRVNALPAQISAVRTSAQTGNDAATRATVLGSIALGLVLLLCGGILTERILARRRRLNPAGSPPPGAEDPNPRRAPAAARPEEAGTRDGRR
jgi:hypothetical protein